MLAVGCTLVVTACGSSGSSRQASYHEAAVAFSVCMRSHGVPNFPDPRAGGGGIQLQAGSGINPFSPAFKAAKASCSHLLPGGGPGARRPTKQLIAQTLRVSECMRRHGVSGFPDPTLTPPSSPAGYSLLENRGGVILAVPDTIGPRSPVFRQAAAACRFR